MVLALLRGENLRLFSRFELRPAARLNLIVGANAAGKTTLLEAIFVLSRARSFRATRASELAGDEGSHWSVFAELEAGEWGHRIGVGLREQSLETRLDQRERVGAAELARALPVQLIEPAAHRLLDDGPAYRRSYIDWGVFHVEQSFIGLWRRYQRALKQRNRALRLNLTKSAVRAWDTELSESGEAITQLRLRHVEQTRPHFERLAAQLLDDTVPTLRLQPGWNTDMPLLVALREQWESHQRAGTTLQGPHRAELKISLADRKAQHRLSRGQQKLLIAAMVMAQARTLIDRGTQAPVLLIDDFESELSQAYQARWAEVLALYPGQVFVTAFEPPQALRPLRPAMFHVEQGVLRHATDCDE